MVNKGGRERMRRIETMARFAEPDPIPEDEFEEEQDEDEDEEEEE